MTTVAATEGYRRLAALWREVLDRDPEHRPSLPGVSRVESMAVETGAEVAAQVSNLGIPLNEELTEESLRISERLESSPEQASLRLLRETILLLQEARAPLSGKEHSADPSLHTLAELADQLADVVFPDSTGRIRRSDEARRSFRRYSAHMESRAEIEIKAAFRWLRGTFLALAVALAVALWTSGIWFFDPPSDSTETLSRTVLSVAAASVATWSGRQYASHRQLEVAYRDAAVRMETLQGITLGANEDDKAAFNAVVAKMLESPIGSVVDKSGPGGLEVVLKSLSQGT